MFGFLKRKHRASDVARELARVALNCGDEQHVIEHAAKEIGIPSERVEAEYRGLRVYMFETVVQTISNECEAGRPLLAIFHQAVDDRLKDFWVQQQSRTVAYDIAWKDPRGVGPSVSMLAAFGERLCSEDDKLEAIMLELTPLWFTATAMPGVFVKYLRSIRIVTD